MNNTIKQIQKLNEVYHLMKRQYTTLKKIFHNHKQIRNTIELSEAILYEAYGMIVDKTEEIESKREFNKIMKGIKDDKNK
jgi:hypothetical protein